MHEFDRIKEHANDIRVCASHEKEKKSTLAAVKSLWIENRRQSAASMVHVKTWRRFESELTSQELLKTHGNVTITILVVAFEHIRHAFQIDTRLYKQIEAHACLARRRAGAGPFPPFAFKRRVQNSHEWLAETVSECD